MLTPSVICSLSPQNQTYLAFPTDLLAFFCLAKIFIIQRSKERVLINNTRSVHDKRKKNVAIKENHKRNVQHVLSNFYKVCSFCERRALCVFLSFHFPLGDYLVSVGNGTLVNEYAVHRSSSYQRQRCEAGKFQSSWLSNSLSSYPVILQQNTVLWTHFLTKFHRSSRFWYFQGKPGAGTVPLITEAPVTGDRPRLGSGTPGRPRPGWWEWPGLRGPEARYRGRARAECGRGDICLGAESRITAFYHLYLLNNCRSIIALIMAKLQTLYKIHIFCQQNVERV